MQNQQFYTIIHNQNERYKYPRRTQSKFIFMQGIKSFLFDGACRKNCSTDISQIHPTHTYTQDHTNNLFLPKLRWKFILFFSDTPYCGQHFFSALINMLMYNKFILTTIFLHYYNH